MSIVSSMKNITKNAPKPVVRGLLVVRKYSPQILTTVGIVGVVGSAVLASKATLKLEDVIDKTKSKLDDAETARTVEGYSDLDYKTDVTKIYVHTAKDIVKLYGPAVTLGLASISCIVGAHGIMQKRNVAAVAAYKTLEQGFSKYRERVIEELGLEKDLQFRTGFREEEVVNEAGEKETVIHIDGNLHNVSDYVGIFESNNVNWKKSPEYNLMFVKCQETFAQQLLSARGHVFLNDVYDSLGMPRTPQGAITGWVLNAEGDNFVDFRIQDFQSRASRVFGTDEELGDCILMDFNVDGIIWDKI